MRTTSGPIPGFTATRSIGDSRRTSSSSSAQLRQSPSGYLRSCAGCLSVADGPFKNSANGPHDRDQLLAPAAGITRACSRSFICSLTLDLPQPVLADFPGRRTLATSSEDGLRSGDTRCRSLASAARGCSAFSEVGTHSTTTASSTSGTVDHTPSLIPGAPA